MRRLIVVAVTLGLLAGCTTMQITTATLPTSGQMIDVLGVAYNNPLTQDLSAVTMFDKDGKPIYSASTGGPGIIKSITANTTAGTTFGVAFPTKADNYSNTNVNSGGSGATAAGGAGGLGGAANAGAAATATATGGAGGTGIGVGIGGAGGAGGNGGGGGNPPPGPGGNPNH